MCQEECLSFRTPFYGSLVATVSCRSFPEGFSRRDTGAWTSYKPSLWTKCLWECVSLVFICLTQWPPGGKRYPWVWVNFSSWKYQVAADHTDGWANCSQISSPPPPSKPTMCRGHQMIVSLWDGGGYAFFNNICHRMNTVSALYQLREYFIAPSFWFLLFCLCDGFQPITSWFLLQIETISSNSIL